MVEHPQVHRLGVVDVLGRGIVAERHDLDTLQPHDAERLGPAAVVADAHADDRVEGAPYFEALVADFEIALFEMLKRRIGQMLGMSRQMDLAVPADDPPVAFDQDRGVVAVELALFLRQLGIAEVKADAELAGEVEQGPGFGPRHLALEKAVNLGLVGHPPAREKRGQRQLGKDNERRAAGMGLAHHRHQPLDDRRPIVGEMDRPQLGDGGSEFARHRDTPVWMPMNRLAINHIAAHYVPIASGLANFFRAAMTESGVSRPVRGFSADGTFSICIDKRAASASTSMR